jgi:carbonic anhydrase/acetyltransferase-like protein (isoleucine patch superfamily)
MIRSFNGKTPQVADSAFISEAAYVVGDVEIGENCSIWPGAVIRGDCGTIRLGNSTIVEDTCVIHSGSPSTPSCIADITIGDNVEIGHGAVINCCCIDNSVLVGMNAIILHDAEIGESSVIGAGCLVPQGMKVPARSFVAGVPGKIRGEASPRQLWWVQEGSQIYNQLAKQYKEEGL